MTSSQSEEHSEGCPLTFDAAAIDWAMPAEFRQLHTVPAEVRGRIWTTMLVLAALDGFHDSWVQWEGRSTADCRTIVDAGALWLDARAEEDLAIRAAFPRLQLEARRFVAAWRRAWLRDVHRLRAVETADRRLHYRGAAERVCGALCESVMKNQETIAVAAAMPTDPLSRSQRVLVLGTCLMVMFTVEARRSGATWLRPRSAQYSCAVLIRLLDRRGQVAL